MLRSIVLAVLVVMVIAAPAVAEDGAEVLKESAVCDVDVDGLGGDDVLAPCKVVNIAHPDGGFTLIIHAQHPEYPYDTATKIETSCLVNWRFWAADGFPSGGAVFVDDAVRHFSATGRMTEVCHFRP